MKPEVIPLPHADDVLSSLGRAKYFSKLDANNGFWQIKLSPKSRELIVFIAPFGKYCFNRLPFGISSAPEHFRRQMCKIIVGIDAILCYMDDIVVFGETDEPYDRGLQLTMEAL